MPTQLTAKAVDQDTYLITYSPLDEEGASVIPSALGWTLTDAAGNVINNQSAVAIAAPGATNNVVLAGDDLKRSDGKSRIVIFEGTYTSPITAAATPLRDTIVFNIELVPYTYDPGTAIGQVRERIGDTDFRANQCGAKPSGGNFTDDEISNALSRRGGDVDRAAADLCETLAIMWAGAGEQITVRGTPIYTTLKSGQYREMAKLLRRSKFTFGVHYGSR